MYVDKIIIFFILFELDLRPLTAMRPDKNSHYIILCSAKYVVLRGANPSKKTNKPLT